MPLEPGFHEHSGSLYNLYPRLVHVRLFGSGYLAGDRARARRGSGSEPLDKKEPARMDRAGLPCETSRAPKAWPLTAGSARPPILFLSLSPCLRSLVSPSFGVWN